MTRNSRMNNVKGKSLRVALIVFLTTALFTISFAVVGIADSYMPADAAGGGTWQATQNETSKEWSMPDGEDDGVTIKPGFSFKLASEDGTLLQNPGDVILNMVKKDASGNLIAFDRNSLVSDLISRLYFNFGFQYKSYLLTKYYYQNPTTGAYEVITKNHSKYNEFKTLIDNTPSNQDKVDDYPFKVTDDPQVTEATASIPCNQVYEKSADATRLKKTYTDDNGVEHINSYENGGLIVDKAEIKIKAIYLSGYTWYGKAVETFNLMDNSTELIAGLYNVISIEIDESSYVNYSYMHHTEKSLKAKHKENYPNYFDFEYISTLPNSSQIIAGNNNFIFAYQRFDFSSNASYSSGIKSQLETFFDESGNEKKSNIEFPVCITTVVDVNMNYDNFGIKATDFNNAIYDPAIDWRNNVSIYNPNFDTDAGLADDYRYFDFGHDRRSQKKATQYFKASYGFSPLFNGDTAADESAGHGVGGLFGTFAQLDTGITVADKLRVAWFYNATSLTEIGQSGDSENVINAGVYYCRIRPKIDDEQINAKLNSISYWDGVSYEKDSSGNMIKSYTLLDFVKFEYNGQSYVQKFTVDKKTIRVDMGESLENGATLGFISNEILYQGVKNQYVRVNVPPQWITLELKPSDLLYRATDEEQRYYTFDETTKEYKLLTGAFAKDTEYYVIGTDASNILCEFKKLIVNGEERSVADLTETEIKELWLKMGGYEQDFTKYIKDPDNGLFVNGTLSRKLFNYTGTRLNGFEVKKYNQIYIDIGFESNYLARNYYIDLGTDYEDWTSFSDSDGGRSLDYEWLKKFKDQATANDITEWTNANGIAFRSYIINGEYYISAPAINVDYSDFTKLDEDGNGPSVTKYGVYQNSTEIDFSSMKLAELDEVPNGATGNDGLFKEYRVEVNGRTWRLVFVSNSDVSQYYVKYNHKNMDTVYIIMQLAKPTNLPYSGKDGYTDENGKMYKFHPFSDRLYSQDTDSEGNPCSYHVLFSVKRILTDNTIEDCEELNGYYQVKKGGNVLLKIKPSTTVIPTFNVEPVKVMMEVSEVNPRKYYDGNAQVFDKNGNPAQAKLFISKEDSLNTTFEGKDVLTRDLEESIEAIFDIKYDSYFASNDSVRINFSFSFEGKGGSDQTSEKVMGSYEIENNTVYILVDGNYVEYNADQGRIDYLTIDIDILEDPEKSNITEADYMRKYGEDNYVAIRFAEYTDLKANGMTLKQHYEQNGFASAEASRLKVSIGEFWQNYAYYADMYYFYNTINPDESGFYYYSNLPYIHDEAKPRKYVFLSAVQKDAIGHGILSGKLVGWEQDGYSQDSDLFNYYEAYGGSLQSIITLNMIDWTDLRDGSTYVDRNATAAQTAKDYYILALNTTYTFTADGTPDKGFYVGNYIIAPNTSKNTFTLYIDKLSLDGDKIEIRDEDESVNRYLKYSGVANLGKVFFVGENSDRESFILLNNHPEQEDLVSRYGDSYIDVSVIGFEIDYCQGEYSYYNRVWDVLNNDIRQMMMAGRYTISYTVKESANYKSYTGTYEGIIVHPATVNIYTTVAIRTYMPEYDSAKEVHIVADINKRYNYIDNIVDYTMYLNTENGELSHFATNYGIPVQVYRNASGEIDLDNIYFFLTGFIGDEKFDIVTEGVTSTDVLPELIIDLSKFKSNNGNIVDRADVYDGVIKATVPFKYNYEFNVAVGSLYVIRQQMLLDTKADQSQSYTGENLEPEYDIYNNAGEYLSGMLNKYVAAYFINVNGEYRLIVKDYSGSTPRYRYAKIGTGINQINDFNYYFYNNSSELLNIYKNDEGYFYQEHIVFKDFTYINSDKSVGTVECQLYETSSILNEKLFLGYNAENELSLYFVVDGTEYYVSYDKATNKYYFVAPGNNIKNVQVDLEQYFATAFNGEVTVNIGLGNGADNQYTLFYENGGTRGTVYIDNEDFFYTKNVFIGFEIEMDLTDRLVYFNDFTVTVTDGKVGKIKINDSTVNNIETTLDLYYDENGLSFNHPNGRKYRVFRNDNKAYYGDNDGNIYQVEIIFKDSIEYARVTDDFRSDSNYTIMLAVGLDGNTVLYTVTEDGRRLYVKYDKKQGKYYYVESFVATGTIDGQLRKIYLSVNESTQAADDRIVSDVFYFYDSEEDIEYAGGYVFKAYATPDVNSADKDVFDNYRRSEGVMIFYQINVLEIDLNKENEDDGLNPVIITEYSGKDYAVSGIDKLYEGYSFTNGEQSVIGVDEFWGKSEIVVKDGIKQFYLYNPDPADEFMDNKAYLGMFPRDGLGLKGFTLAQESDAILNAGLYMVLIKTTISDGTMYENQTKDMRKNVSLKLVNNVVFDEETYVSDSEKAYFIMYIVMARSGEFTFNVTPGENIVRRDPDVNDPTEREVDAVFTKVYDGYDLSFGISLSVMSVESSKGEKLNAYVYMSKVLNDLRSRKLYLNTAYRYVKDDNVIISDFIPSGKYYELRGGGYVLTQDSRFLSGKTYYKKEFYIEKTDLSNSELFSLKHVNDFYLTVIINKNNESTGEGEIPYDNNFVTVTMNYKVSITPAPLSVYIETKEKDDSYKFYGEKNSSVESKFRFTYKGWKVNDELNYAALIGSPAIDWSKVSEIDDPEGERMPARENFYTISAKDSPNGSTHTPELEVNGVKTYDYYFDYSTSSTKFDIKKLSYYIGGNKYPRIEISSEAVYQGTALKPTVERYGYDGELLDETERADIDVHIIGLLRDYDENREYSQEELKNLSYMAGFDAVNVNHYLFVVKIGASTNYNGVDDYYTVFTITRNILEVIFVEDTTSTEPSRGVRNVVYKGNQIKYPSFLIRYSGFLGVDAVYEGLTGDAEYLRTSIVPGQGLTTIGLLHPMYVFVDSAGREIIDTKGNPIMPTATGTYELRLVTADSLYGIANNYTLRIKYYVDEQTGKEQYPILNITKRKVTFEFNPLVNEKIAKTYDGTTEVINGSVTSKNFSFVPVNGELESGIIPGDLINLNITYASSMYARKNVLDENGEKTDIIVKLLVDNKLIGEDADNYEFVRDDNDSSKVIIENGITYLKLYGVINPAQARINFYNFNDQIATGNIDVVYTGLPQNVKVVINGVNGEVLTYEKGDYTINYFCEESNYNEEIAPENCDIYIVTVSIKNTNYVATSSNINLNIKQASVNIVFGGESVQQYGNVSEGISAIAHGVNGYQKVLTVEYYEYLPDGTKGALIEDISKAQVGLYLAVATHSETTNYTYKQISEIFTIIERDVKINYDYNNEYKYTGSGVTMRFYFVDKGVMYFPNLLFDVFVDNEFRPYNYTVGDDGSINVSITAPREVGLYRVAPSEYYTNYRITDAVWCEFRITKADLIVYVADKTINSGDAVNPTIIAKGLKQGDSVATALSDEKYRYYDSVTGQPISAEPTTPGYYKVECYGGTSKNYNLIYDFGVLTINKTLIESDVSVGVNDKSKVRVSFEGSFDNKTDIRVSRKQNYEYSAILTAFASYKSLNEDVAGYNVTDVFVFDYVNYVSSINGNNMLIKIYLPDMFKDLVEEGVPDTQSHIKLADEPVYRLAGLTVEGELIVFEGYRDGDYLCFNTNEHRLKAVSVLTQDNAVIDNNGMVELDWMLYVGIAVGALCIVLALILVIKRD